MYFFNNKIIKKNITKPLKGHKLQQQNIYITFSMTLLFICHASLTLWKSPILWLFIAVL